jgi:hypothetical protein
MENYGQYQGYIVYSTKLNVAAGTYPLAITTVGDRAQVGHGCLCFTVSKCIFSVEWN